MTIGSEFLLEDFERVSLTDQIYLQEYDDELHREFNKNEAVIVLGEARKRSKFERYARIIVGETGRTVRKNIHI